MRIPLRLVAALLPPVVGVGGGGGRRLLVPLHHGAGRHQPVVGPQAQVELLPEGGDVEEELLLGPAGRRRLPLGALLVGGGEQVRQVASVGVGAEGSDEAVFLQPAPQPVCGETRRRCYNPCAET